MLTKWEDIVPRTADMLVHLPGAGRSWPCRRFSPSRSCPYGRNLVPVGMDAGILFFFAVKRFDRTRDFHGRLVEP